MRTVFLLIMMALSVGCVSKREKSAQPYEISEKQRIVNSLRYKAAQETQKQLGLMPSGTAGQMMYQIEMLGLAFDYRKPVIVGEGRELLVRAVDILRDQVNAEKRIFPYLANQPFQEKNIEIRIFLTDPDGRRVKSGELAVITALHGTLSYKIRNSDNLFTTVIHEETYEQAVQILKTQGFSSLPKNVIWIDKSGFYPFNEFRILRALTKSKTQNPTY